MLTQRRTQPASQSAATPTRGAARAAPNARRGNQFNAASLPSRGSTSGGGGSILDAMPTADSATKKKDGDAKGKVGRIQTVTSGGVDMVFSARPEVVAAVLEDKLTPALGDHAGLVKDAGPWGVRVWFETLEIDQAKLLLGLNGNRLDLTSSPPSGPMGPQGPNLYSQDSFDAKIAKAEPMSDYNTELTVYAKEVEHVDPDQALLGQWMGFFGNYIAVSFTTFDRRGMKLQVTGLPWKQAERLAGLQSHLRVSHGFPELDGVKYGPAEGSWDFSTP